MSLMLARCIVGMHRVANQLVEFFRRIMLIWVNLLTHQPAELEINHDIILSGGTLGSCLGGFGDVLGRDNLNFEFFGVFFHFYMIIHS